MRLLYGLPIGGGVKLGAEAQIAYCEEKVESQENMSTWAVLNDDWDIYEMYPHNSKYWQTLLKGSLDGTIGPLDVELTIRGGFDFAGKNEWDYEEQAPPGTTYYELDRRGDVGGWLFGGDLWLRYPLGNGYTLPLLARVDYQQRTLNGMGSEWPANGWSGLYKNEEKDMTITVGGGVDKELNKDTRIAAGIYYVHLSEREDFSWAWFDNSQWNGWSFDQIYPDSNENQVLLRLAGEHTISPAVALRAGLSFFYGWVDPTEKFFETQYFNGSYNREDEGSGSGCPHWGIGAALGGTVKVKPLTLEPYINGGYQELRLNWSYNNPLALYDEALTLREWSVGGGLSILFNL
jgi:hypothetical protein